MTWTQIFKNYYFVISDKFKQKWTMVVSDTFVDLLSAEKTYKFHLDLTQYASFMATLSYMVIC